VWRAQVRVEGTGQGGGHRSGWRAQVSVEGTPSQEALEAGMPTKAMRNRSNAGLAQTTAIETVVSSIKW
jgi:hypothetical protein